MISHKKGEILMLSSGEYSDYAVNCIMEVLRDIDLGSLAEEYFKYPNVKVDSWYIKSGETKEQATKRAIEDGDFCELEHCEGQFAAYLVKVGAARDIECDEVHCGSYGRFEKSAIKTHSKIRASEIAK